LPIAGLEEKYESSFKEETDRREGNIPFGVPQITGRIIAFIR